MDPRLKLLADVLVEIVVREMMEEESRRCREKRNGGLKDLDNGKDSTSKALRRPT